MSAEVPPNPLGSLKERGGHAVIRAAQCFKSSQDPVEGCVNCFKTTKRQAHTALASPSCYFEFQQTGLCCATHAPTLH